MGTVTNISTETLRVELINATLEPGETVDVADDLLDPAVAVWPPTRFLVNGSHQVPLDPGDEGYVEPDPPHPPPSAAEGAPAAAPEPVVPVTAEQGE